MHVFNPCAQVEVRRSVRASTTLLCGASTKYLNFRTVTHAVKSHPRSRFVNDKVSAERQVRRFRQENQGSIVSVLRLAPLLGPTVQNFATRFFSRPVCPVVMGYDPLLQFVHEQDAVDALKRVV